MTHTIKATLNGTMNNEQVSVQDTYTINEIFFDGQETWESAIKMDLLTRLNGVGQDNKVSDIKMTFENIQ